MSALLGITRHRYERANRIARQHLAGVSWSLIAAREGVQERTIENAYYQGVANGWIRSDCTCPRCMLVWERIARRDEQEQHTRICRETQRGWSCAADCGTRELDYRLGSSLRVVDQDFPPVPGRKWFKDEVAPGVTRAPIPSSASRFDGGPLNLEHHLERVFDDLRGDGRVAVERDSAFAVSIAEVYPEGAT